MTFSNLCLSLLFFLFFFNDPPTPEIYTLSLHDALPIFGRRSRRGSPSDLQDHREHHGLATKPLVDEVPDRRDRKSTRLNSSHQIISYAVFCLKKKKNKIDL